MSHLPFLFISHRVDIAGAARARKLRVDESEKTVPGDVYSQRLRVQFEKLHGKPRWAEQSRKSLSLFI